MSANTITFPPFRLDPANACLWRGTKRLALPPKDFVILYHLVTHAGQLVTHAELRKAAWPDAVVSPKGLKAFVHRLRQRLGDKAAKPRFIETVARQGYRFIGKVVSSQDSVDSSEKDNQKAKVAFSSLAPSTGHPTPPLVGRDAELAQLHKWLDKAAGGQRQIVFVTGEPGIGKTALVDAFLQSLASKGQGLESSVQSLASKDSSVPAQGVQTIDPRRQTLDARPWIARGQCVEHHGAGEAYLPILEALGRLCRTAEGEQCKQLLRQQAPTWLVQMPALLEEAELEAIQRKVLGATQERMARELVEAIETLTAERPLVLWVEDLQWSDVSTLDLLLYLVQRRGSAQLLVIGTYRPADVIVSRHPLKALKQELQGHGLCVEVPLRVLTVAEVTQYVAARFAGGTQHAAPLQELGRLIYQRTDGNPLFMVTLVAHLVAQGMIREVAGQWQLQAGIAQVAWDVPGNLRQLIEKQLEGLSKTEQQMLATASVVGMEFSAAAVAATLDIDVLQVEEGCAALARRQLFVQPSAGRVAVERRLTSRYQFRHALYQQILYEGLTPLRQRQLHQRIGEWKEAAYGERVRGIAAELAVHFEQGQDYGRALRYLQQAGENALRRSACTEAIAHLTRGLELLQILPDTPERTRYELMLQATLSVPLLMTRGYAAPEVEKACTRARDLCRQVGKTPQLFSVLFGLFRVSLLREELQTARELSEQLLCFTQSEPDPQVWPVAHAALGGTLFHLGELAMARSQVEQGIRTYDRQQHGPLIFQYGDDPGAVCLGYAAWSLQALGYPDQALSRSRECLALAQELSHPFILASSFGSAAIFHQLRREGKATQEKAEAAITLSNEHGFSPWWLAVGTIMQGWALAEQGQAQEGIAQMRESLRTLQALGVRLWWPYFLALLAEAHGKVGQHEEELSLLAEGLAAADNTGERLYEAELWRLYGELSLRIGETETPAEESENRGQGESETSERESVSSSPVPRFSGSPVLSSPARFPGSSPEESFQKAIEIARQQSAKSFELRAVVSLSRLWQRQGKKEEARQMLAEIYGWFTEGFDTKDLQEAKALLEELDH